MVCVLRQWNFQVRPILFYSGPSSIILYIVSIFKPDQWPSVNNLMFNDGLKQTIECDHKAVLTDCWYCSTFDDDNDHLIGYLKHLKWH